MNIKNKRILSPKEQKDERIIKQPLFKMFMNDSKRKLHLIKHNISNSKDSSKSYHFENNNKKKIQHKIVHLDLQLFSYKILEAKHNSTPELYLKRNLNILIKRKRCHFLANFNENILTRCQLRDYLKRYYTYEETKERIPKYVSYYKNYLTFFCRPFFVGYIVNKKMVKHMEKIAQIFYNENYADEDDTQKGKPKKNKEKNIIIFSKKIMKEIEDADIYTAVNSESPMKQIPKLNILLNKKLPVSPKIISQNNNIKKDNAIENKMNPIKIEEISVDDNNHKITAIKKSGDNIEIKTNEITQELKNKELNQGTINSINLLIEQLESKEIKDDLNNNKEDNLKKNFKNIQNNFIQINGGKAINNINININHLIISPKPLSKKDEQINKRTIDIEIIKSNSKNKKIKKIRNTNSNKKEKNDNQNQKNENKDNINNKKEFEKNREDHRAPKKTSTLTLPPPNHNSLSRTNSVINKNYKQIFPNTLNNNNNLKYNKNIKNQYLFKNSNKGTMTNLQKYISFAKGNYSQNNLGKKTLYTNDSNRLSSIFNNINNGTSKASKNINIISVKNPGILSGERARSISNMKNRQTRIIYSTFRFNGTNRQLNLKNSIGIGKNLGNISSSTGKKVHELKNKNGKMPMINNKDEDNKTTKKQIKLKGKHINLQKLLNVFPKKVNKADLTDF